MLRERWLSLSGRLHVPVTVAERWWTRIHDSYEDKGRFYHTTSHLQDLLGHSDRNARMIDDRTAVELAIWFHDIHYDARAPFLQNERKSCEVFQAFAAEAGCLPAPLVAKVSRWIILTASHRVEETDDMDCRLFMDFDMSVMAKPSREYDAYAAQVRAEYAHLNSLLWGIGRCRFLTKAVASSERTFMCDAFSAQEDQARANARRELARHQTVICGYVVYAAMCATCLVTAVVGGARHAMCSGSLLALGAAVKYVAIDRGFIPFPHRALPKGGCVVFAASFNPPHLGHAGILRRLSMDYKRVHAVVSENPNKCYDVSAEDRCALLGAMVASEGLENVEVCVHHGYVWRRATALGATHLFRGVRTWKEDGFAERLLEVLNTVGPITLGGVRPVPTILLGADPRYAHVSSTLIRSRLSADAPIDDLVTPGFASSVRRLYGERPADGLPAAHHAPTAAGAEMR